MNESGRAIAVALDPDAVDGSGRHELTGLARGPWQEDAAHGGAPAGLLARAAESLGAEDDLRLASISLAFNGPVTLGEFEIRAETIKPGRRQRVVAVAIDAGGRTLIEGRAVLIRRGEVDLPDGVKVKEERFPGPDQGRPVEKELWADGDSEAFHRTSNTVVAIEGGPDRVGTTGMVWIRLDYPLVAGDPLTGAQRAVAAADFGNGVAHPVGWGEYLFINCDLNVSLLREPEGDWIGLESRTEVDRNGSGLTTTRLHDQHGHFGNASQILFVDQT